MSNLVYNTCWEDPRCDRELLQIKEDSKIVMITSAGCNALDYLLQGPAEIHCVDVNPRQNALLELKRSSLQNNTFEDHFRFFGHGRLADAQKLYEEKLRNDLTESAQRYWDKNIRFFNGKGIKKSFYHYGTSGSFAWMAHKYFKSRKKLYEVLKAFFNAKTLEEQTELYLKIEPKILNKAVEWFMNKHVTMSLLGVPRSQQELFAGKYDRGVVGYVQECLRKVFTQLPVWENYFYQLYFNGKYSEDCCPEYLKKENFESLKGAAGKISQETTMLASFLKENPGEYTQYVLLDHQDWLAANNREALHEEWDLILKNSKPGTRILLRSAALEVDFFPDFVTERLVFDREIMAKTHQEDRVGTYASVYLGVVKA